MNTKKIIARSALYYANKKAIVFGNQSYTFREVHDRAIKLANGLINLGVRKGDVVASITKNCPHHVEIAFALGKCGAVTLALNPRLRPEEICWQLNRCEASTLIISEEHKKTFEPIVSELKSVKSFISISSGLLNTGSYNDYEELISKSSTKEPDIPTRDEDIARIVFTGGTTGMPKGVIHTLRTEWAVTRNLLLDMLTDISSSDVFLAMQPLYHGAGSYVAPVWIRGAKHVIVSDFDPEITLEVIEKEKVTVLKTVPTLLIRLIGHPDIKKRDLSSLRTIVYGASPIPTEKLKEAISIFGPILIQTYGQSEAPNTITLLKKEDHVVTGHPVEVARLSSAGRPYSEVEVRIIDEKGNDVPPRVEGEVIVKGDVTMGGYWRDSVKTAETFRDGWIYTGDIGRWDEAGYLYLVDRKGEMIISGGLNIYPSEVEQVLNEHKAVLEAAVFGVPDESWGESVKAVVVLKPGFKASEQELIEFCKNRLPGYKKPKSVEFKDNLPKSGAGKILRKPLRDEYWKGYDRRIH